MKNECWSELIEAEILKNEQPIFVYDVDKIKENVDCIRHRIFTNHSKIYFSVKSNSNNFLLSKLSNIVDGFDVSSMLELICLKNLGVSASRITLSGPGKTDECLALAGQLGVGCLHIDSYQEWEVLNKLKESGKPIPNLSLRLQIDEGASQFKLGLSEEPVAKILINSKEGSFTGIHCYLGRESFSENKLKEIVQKMEALISANRLKFVDEPNLYIGPGIPSLSYLNFKPIQKLSKYPIKFEVGRAIMSNAGYYGAPVLSVKSFQNNIVIINGGVHHLGSPVLSVFAGGSSANYFFIRDRNVLNVEEGKNKNYSIYGSLCLSHDCIHPRVQGPEDLGRGDWIVFSECGSYGLTAAVPYFIGQDLPREFLVELDPKHDTNTIKEVTPSLFKPYHECFKL